MSIVGVITYSDEVSALIGHSNMLEVSSWGEKYYIDFDDYLAAANTVKDYGHRVSDSEFVDMWVNLVGSGISTNLFYIKEKT